MAYRSSAAQRLAPAPALPGCDELDRTARQVRLDHRAGEPPVHVLADSRVDPWDGIVYRTVCRKMLTAGG